MHNWAMQKKINAEGRQMVNGDWRLIIMNYELRIMN